MDAEGVVERARVMAGSDVGGMLVFREYSASAPPAGDDVVDSDIALENAAIDMGKPLPVEDGTREAIWYVRRTYRHLLSLVRNKLALRYDAKGFSERQKLENIRALIGEEDEAFEAEMGRVQGPAAFGLAVGTGWERDSLSGKSYRTRVKLSPTK